MEATLKRKRNHFTQQADKHFILGVGLPKNSRTLDMHKLVSANDSVEFHCVGADMVLDWMLADKEMPFEIFDIVYEEISHVGSPNIGQFRLAQRCVWASGSVLVILCSRQRLPGVQLTPRAKRRFAMR